MKLVLRLRLPITIVGIPFAAGVGEHRFQPGQLRLGRVLVGSLAASEPSELSITITRTVPPAPLLSKA